MIFHHHGLNFTGLDHAAAEWKLLNDLIFASQTLPEDRTDYERRQRQVRKKLDAAKVDLDLQRKEQVEHWAAAQGLRVNWEQ